MCWGAQDTMNERSLSTVQDLQDGKWAGGASARNGMNVTMLTGDSQVYPHHHFPLTTCSIIRGLAKHAAAPPGALPGHLGLNR